jgi:hypothetical protein
MWHAVVQLVEAMRCKPEVASSIFNLRNEPAKEF